MTFRRGGSNPVGAFLAGFAAVDQLETNRQRRDFLEQQGAFAVEQQSRTRKMWAREDEEYGRIQLERYRADKLAEFDATVRDLMNDPNTTAEMLADPTTIFSEATKRMIAKDPGFGEHAALAVGLDPGAGPLVDSSNPVSGIIPNPERGLAFELNTINGDKQPYTENRTSADNDPVAFRNVGMSELTRIFGPGVLQNDLAIAQQLRNLAGVQPTGAPTESIDNRREQRADTVTTAATRQEGGARTFPLPPDPVIEGEHIPAPTPEQLERSAELEATQETTNVYKPPSDVTAFDALKDSDTPIVRGLAVAADSIADGLSHVPGALRYASAEAKNNFVDFSYAVANKVNEAFGIESDLSRKSAAKKRALDRSIERAAENNFASNSAAEKPSDVPNPATYNPTKIAAEPEAAVTAVASAPVLTEQGVQAAATNLQKATGRPTIPQMYNAVALTKMNVLTPEQLMTYARTGQFDKPAKAQINLVTSKEDGITTVFRDGVPTSQVRTGSGTATGDTPSDEEDFDLSVKLLEDFFRDYEGKADPAAARQAVRQFDRTRDVISNRFNEGNPIPIDQNFANDFEEGLKFQRRYEDPRSVLNPGRWFDSRELGRQSGTLGYAAVKLGITSQEDFNNFAFEFGINFGEFATSQNWSEERLLTQQLNMEDHAQALVRDGTYKSIEKAREEVREATVKAIIDRNSQRE